MRKLVTKILENVREARDGGWARGVKPIKQNYDQGRAGEPSNPSPMHVNTAGAPTVYWVRAYHLIDQDSDEDDVVEGKIGESNPLDALLAFCKESGLDPRSLTAIEVAPVDSYGPSRSDRHA